MGVCRTEHDLLGEREVPAEALYGIHTARAVENFPLSLRPVHPGLVRAYGAVKLAAARVNHELGRWDEGTFRAIEAACLEMMDGALERHILVDALQGGAGTSTNMNVNEVLANRALQLLGAVPGDYARIHPLEDINRHQSTNDTYPTALRVAALFSLRRLQGEAISLLGELQGKELQFAHVVKVGRTEMQDAVLTTLGRAMGAWAEAIARDRWRIYKCEERLRVVNLGGTAIGTGIGAPREYIFRVVDRLREITGLGLARAENLIDGTQNADAYVEVGGILKAAATNLVKIASDLRLLSSGPEAGIGEIRLPARQAGSSLMPAKVNPVIPEAVTQAALRVAANDQALGQACGMGSLELNPFLPLVADCLLENLDLLARAARILGEHCIRGLQADEARCRRGVEASTAAWTALADALGYERAQEISRLARDEGKSVREAALAHGGMTEAEFEELIAPDSVMRLGSPPPEEPE